MPAAQSRGSPGNSPGLASMADAPTLLPTENIGRPGANARPETRSDPSPQADEDTDSGEPGGLLSHELTDFLAPPQGPGELGRLGSYRILKVLGAGGMGVVYQAEDLRLQRLVALKAMLPTLGASARARQRFLREARAAAALKHDHIVTIYQVDEDRGVPFLAMEFLQGEALDLRLQRQGVLPVAEVLRIGREVAEGLAAAHARGLVHRDIKPQNVWLEENRGRAKILDFGLARCGSEAGQLTQSGAIMGTPAYMAPEQASGGKVDGRSDLFSLGCVLYQLATGERPFQGADMIATLMAAATHNPPPPHERNPDLPPALSALVVQLLSKDPAGRPQTADEVVETLQALERDVVPTGTARTGTGHMARVRQEKTSGATLVAEVASRGPGRRRWRFTALGGVTAALLLAGVVLFWPTPTGTVHIEINDPDIKVTFDKDGPTITGADKQPITLRPGDHGIVVTRGDFTFETEKFVLKKGQTVTLKIEFLEGKVRVVKDEKVIAERDVPLPKSFTTAAPLGGSTVLVPGAHGWTVLPRDHLGSVTLAAYSNNSRRLASGGRDGTVRLWDPAGGRLRCILLGHTGPVTSLAWSPDGKTLASGSDDLTVRLWDADAGRLLHTLKGHTGGVLTLAWSRDGKRLASGGHDQSVRLWQAGSGEVERVFREQKGPVTAVAWRPDDKSLVSFSIWNNLYCLWEAGTGIVLSSRTGLGHWAWSPDYKVLALKTGKNTVAFWDADADKVLRTLTLREQKLEIAGLAWSPDGKVLATGEGYDGSEGPMPAHLWDAVSGKLLHTTEGGNRRVCGQVAFSPDGQLLASSGGYDHSLHLWQTATGKRVHDLPGLWHTSSPNFSPDGKTVWGVTEYPITSGHTLVFWDTATANRRHLQAYRPDSQEVAWSPDGKMLATVTAHWGRCQVRLWEGRSGQLRRVLDLPRPGGGSRVLAWSPDGKSLAGAVGQELELWDAVTGDSRRKLAGKPAGGVHALAWSPDGKLLASFANEAWLWDTTTGKALRPLTGQPVGSVLDLAWSPDGKTLATGNQHWAGVDLWDVVSGKHRPRLEGHKARVTAVAWSPDGKTLASGSDDATVRLWVGASGKFQIDLKDPEQQGPVTALSWLPGGKTLATLNSKNTVCVWNTAAGTLLRSTKSVRGAGRFAPDGRLLASTNDVEGVRLWEADSGRLRGTLVFLQPEAPNQYLVVSGDGHYRGVPPRLIDREMVYVVQTDRGQETLTPAEFEKKYGWKNDPDKVRLVGQ